MSHKRPQTPSEEYINTLTHLLGVLFCLIAIPFTLMKAGSGVSPSSRWAVMAFGGGMLMVYSFSSLYHATRDISRKALMQKLDHIGIFFLIAGTYTPLVIQYLPPYDAKVFLIVLWSLVAAGALYKIFYTGRHKAVSVSLYVAMGWMVVFIIKPILSIPPHILFWIVAGGMSYMVGVYFYVQSNKPYYHSIWHGFVLGGTVCHYVAVHLAVG